MDELINGRTAAEIKSAIEHCRHGNCDDCLHHGSRFCKELLWVNTETLIYYLESRIAELEAKQPKWISVKDKLPDAHQHVIVHVKHTPKYDAGWHVVEQDCWLGESWECNADEEVHLVTHWMPLPEPPKEDA